MEAGSSKVMDHADRQGSPKFLMKLLLGQVESSSFDDRSMLDLKQGNISDMEAVGMSLQAAL